MSRFLDSPAPAMRVLVLGLAVLSAASARGQSRSRSGSGGSTFPTWEREVDSSETVPLPEGQPGHLVPAFAVELGARVAGVGSTDAGGFAVVLEDGGVRWFGADGEPAGELSLGAAVTLAPASTPAGVLVVSSDRVILLTRMGIVWESSGPEVLAAPVAGPSGILIIRSGSDGATLVERLEPESGKRLWSREISGELAAASASLPDAVLLGTPDGRVLGLDAGSGAQLWEVKVMDSLVALGAGSDAAHASGTGITGRSKDRVPVLVAIELRDGGKRAAAETTWRLRTGGACTTPPMLIDELVVVACTDSYARAVGRRRGLGGWKTDLPSRSPTAPLLTGGRLDFVLAPTGTIVSLAADNGAVLGWSSLPDADETLAGAGATHAGVLGVATTFGRFLGFTWAWDEKEATERDTPSAREKREALTREKQSSSRR